MIGLMCQDDTSEDDDDSEDYQRKRKVSRKSKLSLANTGMLLTTLAQVCSLVVGSHRGTPRRGSSASDSDASDFGTRPSKRRRILKASHRPKVTDILLPAERTSSRLGAKVVNYNEDEEDSVNEDDLMPNEHGEVWTYGIASSGGRLSVVEEPEAQDAIDAIVDHRGIMQYGIHFH